MSCIIVGTSAIAASSLLDELHWNESQLGHVQSAFFVGYALTQVFGGLIGGRRLSSTDMTTCGSNSVGDNSNDDDFNYDVTFTSRDAEYGMRIDKQPENNINRDNTSSKATIISTQKRQEGYRTIVPLSLILTGITTLLFPVAATAGPNWAVLDRFSLGLLEGVLLPAAMAGVSSTTTPSSLLSSSDATTTTIITTLERKKSTGNNNEIKATASAIVIAGCYLGSAWAYLSAWLIFSETSQVHLTQWGLLQQESPSSVWPLLFYINGILSLFITVVFSSEFDLLGWRRNSNINNNTTLYSALLGSTMVMMKDATEVAKETLSSKSGRAIIAAQIGQGALLYSIASWCPLYLERIADVSTTGAAVVGNTSTTSSFVSSTAVAASIAASSLIIPQITQAVIGVSIGLGADKLSSIIGPRLTRRSLQFISGVGPGMILIYLSFSGTGSVSDGGHVSTFQSPSFLFGAAQTISAISLGAVSVSHLEVATPSKSGAVYALGNVFAAISGSITVTIFGILLDKNGQQVATTAASDFSLPLQIVAILSSVGSIFYSLSIESDLEIGMQEIKKHRQ